MDRAIPVFNKQVIERKNNLTLDTHRKRLNSIKQQKNCNIQNDSSNNISYNYTENNQYKCMKNKDIFDKKGCLMLEERRAEIERENVLLMNKMSKIMVKLPKFVRDIPKAFENHPMTLNGSVRANELIKISSDNQQMLNRIKNQKTSYSVKKYFKLRQQEESFLKNIRKISTHKSTRKYNDSYEGDMNCTSTQDDLIFRVRKMQKTAENNNNFLIFKEIQDFQYNQKNTIFQKERKINTIYFENISFEILIIQFSSFYQIITIDSVNNKTHQLDLSQKQMSYIMKNYQNYETLCENIEFLKEKIQLKIPRLALFEKKVQTDMNKTYRTLDNKNVQLKPIQQNYLKQDQIIKKRPNYMERKQAALNELKNKKQDNKSLDLINQKTAVFNYEEQQIQTQEQLDSQRSIDKQENHEDSDQYQEECDQELGDNDDQKSIQQQNQPDSSDSVLNQNQESTIKKSQVKESNLKNSQIKESTVKNSQITEINNSQIKESTIKNSLITEIKQSQIKGSTVKNSQIAESNVKKSQISKKSNVKKSIITESNVKKSQITESNIQKSQITDKKIIDQEDEYQSEYEQEQGDNQSENLNQSQINDQTNQSIRFSQNQSQKNTARKSQIPDKQIKENDQYQDEYDQSGEADNQNIQSQQESAIKKSQYTDKKIKIESNIVEESAIKKSIVIDQVIDENNNDDSKYLQEDQENSEMIENQQIDQNEEQTQEEFDNTTKNFDQNSQTNEQQQTLIVNDEQNIIIEDENIQN